MKKFTLLRVTYQTVYDLKDKNIDFFIDNWIQELEQLEQYKYLVDKDIPLNTDYYFQDHDMTLVMECFVYMREEDYFYYALKYGKVSV